MITVQSSGAQRLWSPCRCFKCVCLRLL